MSQPSIGDKVLVRPLNGHQVQEHEHIFGRFMPSGWTARVFDEWLFSRLRDGSIEVKPQEEHEESEPLASPPVAEPEPLPPAPSVDVTPVVPTVKTEEE